MCEEITDSPTLQRKYVETWVFVAVSGQWPLGKNIWGSSYCKIIRVLPGTGLGAKPAARLYLQQFWPTWRSMLPYGIIRPRGVCVILHRSTDHVHDISQPQSTFRLLMPWHLMSKRISATCRAFSGHGDSMTGKIGDFEKFRGKYRFF